jgi:toxin YoeB
VREWIPLWMNVMRSWAGDLAGAYSRRINIQHRLVYQELEDERVVKVLRLWSHYE